MSKWRRYRWVPTAFMLVSMAVCLGLGAWQMQRKAWKEDLLQRIAAAQESLPLTQLPKEPEALTAQEFRRVQIAGTFFPEKSLYLGGRFRDGESGYFVLTPLYIKGDGRAVLVNRGFITLPMRPTFEGLHYNGLNVPVEGIVRLPREKKRFLPDNSPTRNTWFWEDMPAIRSQTGLDLLPIVIEVTSDKSSVEYPRPSRGRINIRNDHLGYAVTWFSMALVALVMLILYQRKLRRDADAA